MTTDNTIMKSLACILLLTAMTMGEALAAPRDAGGGGAKIINKLQTMVREATSERDLLKSENAKIVAELESIKNQQKQDKDAALIAQEKLAQELAIQKGTSDEVKVRLENTTAKLREVIEKYNALNKAKNELAAIYANLQNTQQATTSELKSCEAKNMKMFEGAQEVIEGFQSCQKRGIMDTLIGSEPFSQIKNVEFETIMQGYEDKLRKQKYQNKFPQVSVPVAETAKPAPASASSAANMPAPSPSSVQAHPAPK